MPLSQRKPSVVDVLKELTKSSKKLTDVSDDEVVVYDERIPLRAAQDTSTDDTQTLEPIPWSEFNKIHAQTIVEESKKGIKNPYDLVADIFLQNALLGPRQKFKYDLFCNVVRFLYRKQHKKGLPGVSRSAIQRGIAADQRLEVPAILVSGEKKDIINRFELRERIVYALSIQTATMLEQNILAKWRDTLENG